MPIGDSFQSLPAVIDAAKAGSSRRRWVRVSAVIVLLLLVAGGLAVLADGPGLLG